MRGKGKSDLGQQSKSNHVPSEINVEGDGESTCASSVTMFQSLRGIPSLYPNVEVAGASNNDIEERRLEEIEESAVNKAPTHTAVAVGIPQVNCDMEHMDSKPPAKQSTSNSATTASAPSLTDLEDRIVKKMRPPPIASAGLPLTELQDEIVKSLKKTGTKGVGVPSTGGSSRGAAGLALMELEDQILKSSSQGSRHRIESPPVAASPRQLMELEDQILKSSSQGKSHRVESPLVASAAAGRPLMELEDQILKSASQGKRQRGESPPGAASLVGAITELDRQLRQGRGSHHTETDGLQVMTDIEAKLEGAMNPIPSTPPDPVSVPGAWPVPGGRFPIRQSEPESTGTPRNSHSRPSASTTSVESLCIDGATVVEDSTDEVDVEQPEEGLSSQDSEVIEGVILSRKTTPTNQHEQQQHRRSIKFIFGWLALSILFIVGVVILLTLVHSGSSHGSSLSNSTTTQGETIDPNPETPNPQHRLIPPYTQDLPHEYLSGMQDPSSTYYLANAWMARDPYLSTYSPTRQKQRFSLVYFFYQSNGHNWYRNDDWLSYNVSECSWYNQNSSLEIGGWHQGTEPEPTCDQDNNLLVLNLTSNNLRGSEMVPSDGLSYMLKVYDVSNNGIYGPFPPAAEHALNLQVFILSNNKIEGAVTGGTPSRPFASRIVKLDGNKLFGYHPLSCQLMPHLEEHDLTGNFFDQAISTNVQYCKNLTLIAYGDNEYEGQLPSELGLLSRLREIDVSGNKRMSGTLPTELTLLPNLEILDITGTATEGSVPEGLCTKVDERSLHLSANCSSVECCL